ncbi:hypothetical protein D3C80_1401640 [compost metagenome]
MRIHRRIVIDIVRRGLQQFDRLRIVCGSGLGIHQQSRQHDSAAFAARKRSLLRQRFCLSIFAMLEMDLREQRHGVDITALGGFFGPQPGLLIITRTEPGVCQVVLRARITGFSLFFKLAANFVSVGKCCKQ